MLANYMKPWFTYTIFQGTPTRLLKDGDAIDLGESIIKVVHAPGHSPGHMCFFEAERGYLYTGDLVYKDMLPAYYPSTDPQAYLQSLEKVSSLPVKHVLPAHRTLDIQREILFRMRDALGNLDSDNKLHHGSGVFNYGDWSIWL